MKTDFEVVATTNTLQQADVVRVKLAGEGFDAVILGETSSSMLNYLNFAINPRGVRVAVPPDQADAARRVLEEVWAALPAARQDSADYESETPEADKADTPDDLARRAYLCSFFAILVPLLLPLTLYWLIRVLGDNRPPLKPRRYRLHLIVAVVVGVVLPAALLAIYITLYISSLSPAPVPAGESLDRTIHVDL